MRDPRRPVLALALALAFAAAAALFLFSAGETRVQPFREAEALWAMEDERRESGTPLLRAMDCDGRPLAFDRESATFYCTLGLLQGDEWPELHLTLPEGGVSCCFADDLLFDSCRDAVREGYAYRLFCWTEEAFCYQQIVFTGLPTALLTTSGQELTREDSPGRLSVSAWGEAPLESDIRLHVRGGVSYRSEKRSYRLDFVRGEGRGKVSRAVPSFGEAEGLILSAMAHDESLVRERMGWALWGKLAPRGQPFGERRTGYCELFIDGRYEGVYLLQDPMPAREQLALAASPQDSVYRTKSAFFTTGERPSMDFPLRENVRIVCYAVPSEDAPFAALAPLFSLQREEDDAAFLRQAKALVDLDSLIAYDLFIQAGGMTDSVYNNLWIWAHGQGDALRYRFCCWDLDTAWGQGSEERLGAYEDDWVSLPLMDRLLALDGETRARYVARWRAMQAAGFDEAPVIALAEGFASELEESGAWARNAARWGLEETLPMERIVGFCAQRFPVMERAMARLSEEPFTAPPFLAESAYDRNNLSVDEDT